jgi:hypothetical protein
MNASETDLAGRPPYDFEEVQARWQGQRNGKDKRDEKGGKK